MFGSDSKTFLPIQIHTSLLGITSCGCRNILLKVRYEEGLAEKQGKHLWATRYLCLVGCRLLVFRYPINRKRGNQNLPLNVIDLTNALVTRNDTKSMVTVSTHRDVVGYGVTDP